MSEHTILLDTKDIHMKQALLVADSKVINMLIGLAMASLWGLFAYRHLMAFSDAGDWTYLVVCFSETLTAGLFLFRSAPVTVSRDPLDWLFALGGTFTALLFAPSAWGILPAAKILVVLGTVMQIFGLISLNRSFALVAAKREIKTRGMYNYIRHPLYSSYLIIFTGYILTNTTWMNFALYVMTMAFLFVRLQREEKHLSLDPKYAEYMLLVRYRVIPYIF